MRLRGSRDGDEIGDGIELDEGDLSVMTLQLQQGLCDGLRQASLRELPELPLTRDERRSP